MNKLLLSIAFAFIFSNPVHGQTTITNQSALEVGDVLSAQFTDTSASEGPAGAGQAWDFSDLPKVGPEVAIPVVSVASTGYQSQFTTATMAIDYEGTNFTFLKTTDTTMEITGVVSDGNPFIYDNSEIIFKYPFSYASSFADTFSGSYTLDSVTVSRTGTVSFLCDANGTLIMPTGVVSSTLRIKFIEMITDVAHYGNIAVTTTTNSTSYFWMIASNKNPLMKITYTTKTANGITTESEEDYYYVSFVSVNEINPVLTGLTLFPNPTTGNLFFAFDLGEDAQLNLSVKNYLGQKVKSLGVKDLLRGNQLIELETDELPAGFYLLHIEMENSSPIVVKFRKE
ncbi:MAG: T9SS type A sorting domain-containing protein [Chitinophagales bacterium]|nr:T9SS type A sorting domain-containing protein [Chitinophagales bacterium]